jgi:hypothetical protein
MVVVEAFCNTVVYLENNGSDRLWPFFVCKLDIYRFKIVIDYDNGVM